MAANDAHLVLIIREVMVVPNDALEARDSIPTHVIRKFILAAMVELLAFGILVPVAALL